MYQQDIDPRTFQPRAKFLHGSRGRQGENFNTVTAGFATGSCKNLRLFETRLIVLDTSCQDLMLVLGNICSGMLFIEKVVCCSNYWSFQQLTINKISLLPLGIASIN